MIPFYFFDLIGSTQELGGLTRYMTVFWCRYQAFPHTMFHRMAAALFGATGLQLLPSSSPANITLPLAMLSE